MQQWIRAVKEAFAGRYRLVVGLRPLRIHWNRLDPAQILVRTGCQFSPGKGTRALSRLPRIQSIRLLRLRPLRAQ